MTSGSAVAAAGTQRRKPWRGLQATAVGAVLLIAVPVLFLLGWSAAQLRKASTEDIATSARAIVHLASHQHTQLLVEARTLLATLSRMPQLRGDPADCSALLASLLTDRSGYANLGVVAPDGRARCSALPFEPGLNLGDRAYFQRALTTGRFTAGDYQVGRITRVPGINFGYPLRDAQEQVRGVVFAAVEATWLPSLTDPKVLPARSVVELLDHRLALLARYPQLPGGPEPGRRTQNAPVLAKAIAERPDHGSFTAAGPDGMRRLYAYSRLGGAALEYAPYLVLGLPPGALQTRQERILVGQTVGVAVALIVLMALAWWIVHRRVLLPVRQLTQAAGRLASGHSGVRLDAIGGTDEFAAVADAFNHMAASTDAAVRGLAVLSAGNRTLLRQLDEQALLEAMCQVAVDAGGYRNARVAYVTEAGIRQMASAGDDGGFASHLQAYWGSALAHQTPTARAIASGEPVVLNDATITPAEHDLFKVSVRCGLRAGLALPLRVDGSVIGALTIYAPEADVFGPREVGLLSEMAGDLSFGIATARLREREQQADTRLRHLAYFDPVTGLPNQASFFEQTSAVAASGSGLLAVLVVQVQNYWEIAATLGQGSGDEFLNDVARRLEALSPTLLARVAQSEFALLVLDADESAANREANRALASLAPPAQLASINVDIQATVGMAVGGRRPGDADNLLQAAKLAAHEAGSGAARVLLAHPQLDKQWRDRLTLAGDLRAAIDSRALRVYMQPQLDLRSGQICGMEALARWHHPRHGEVSPARFIGLAEKTGLIRPLTYAILDGVYELAGRHAAAGLLLPVAVNISARNLHDPEFVGRITGLLERWPLPRACLHLELTETAVMDDPVHSLKVLKELHDLGLSIYLDDFGTGYSSMAYLRELPLSGLKVDRAFIIGLAQPDTRRIVQAMIDLGHALGLKVVAEGTENEATLAILGEMGCDIAQGYGIARPIPGVQIAPWIARWPAQRVISTPHGDAPGGQGSV